MAKKIQIVPHNNLREHRDSQCLNKWESTGNDPQFLIYPQAKFFKRFGKGWYLLRVRLTDHEHKDQFGKIYLDYGEGISESSSFGLAWQSTKYVNRFFYIEKATKYIRFDPCEQPTFFTLNSCQLIKVPEPIAIRALLERLQYFNGDHDGMDSLKNKLKSLAIEQSSSYKEVLQELYNQSFSQTQNVKSYQSWLMFDEPKILNKALSESTVTSNVKFSILLPTYNTPIQLLVECIESVLAQTHTDWQLCIADDASTSNEVADLLRGYEKRYPGRIDVVILSENGHICKASNAALNLAKNSFTLLLDHDDILPKYCLELFARAIVSNPNAQVLYGDEDKIDADGLRHMPHFKPDWNADLLLSQNYICHPVVFRTELLRKVGGFRVGYEGSQDHDLLLRATARLTDDQIVHLPYILYHWRVIDNSTASHAGAKDYTTEAGIKAVVDFFEDKGLNYKVSVGSYPNTYRVSWPIVKPLPLISIIIPTRDGFEILKQCLMSIYEKTDYANYEVLVVDNQTTCEKTLQLFELYCTKYSNFRVLKWDAPFNYSSINNYAVNKAKGSIIALVNNDIEVISRNWLTEMVSHAIRPEIGCVGAKLYYSNNTIQHAGVILGIGGVAGHSHKYFNRSEPGYFSRLHLVQNVSAVTAACLVVEKSIFEAAGGLNEVDLTVAFNDVDFCLKVKTLGYRNLFTPWAELYHHESISRGGEDTPEKIHRFNKEAQYMRNTWGHLLSNDPAYNSNLTDTHENFTIK